MNDGIEITVEGLPEFDHAMTELVGPAGERIMRRAARAGGRVFQTAITEAAPVRPVGVTVDSRTGKAMPASGGNSLPPGALKNDIVVRVTKEQDGSISSFTSPGKRTRHVARFVEYGHQLVIHGKNVGEVPAYPFIRPAFELAELPAQEATAQEIAVAFIQEAAKQQIAEGD